MTVYARALRIANQIKRKVPALPDTAIVLGSGLGSFANSIEKSFEIEYKKIKHSPVSTVSGHAGKLIFGTVFGKPIVAMQGRFHCYEGYDTATVTLYIRVFQLLGVKNIILTTAAGSINEDLKPGDFMLISDHISLFCDSPLYGPNDERFGPRFPAMDKIYTKSLQTTALAAAEKIGISLKTGVHCFCKGPMYETPAEIRAIKILGADTCSMSTVPEAIVAAHGNMNVLGISLITNMAAGISAEKLSHEEVISTGKAAEENFKGLITEILKML